MVSTTSPGDFRPVRGISDILIMRALRNEVRSYMTHNTNPISITHQARWYYQEYLPAVNRGETAGFLIRHNGRPVGYGLVTTRDGLKWVSGGLVEEARGKGLGEQLFKSLTRYARFFMGADEVWLDVLRDNHAAKSLYVRLGYEFHNKLSDDNVLVMSYRPTEGAS